MRSKNTFLVFNCCSELQAMYSVLIFTLLLKLATAQTENITEKYQAFADQIRDYFLQGDGHGETFEKLRRLVDTFGPRYATSQAYNKAAAFLMDELKAAGVDRVWIEPVNDVPLWSRGDPNPGQAFLLKPREQRIPILALGNSTATPSCGLRARAIVVASFDELAALPPEKVAGRIVVFNQPWLGSYSGTVAYRMLGAIKAAERGAVAALIRSITPESLYTLHTGNKNFPVPGIRDIPVASITVEDAELLYRLQGYGEELVMSLEINSKYMGKTSSFNIVADLVGTTYPNEIVLFGGHFDSWDVGQGAVDDGGGVAITWEAITTLAKLGLRPKRTIRAVFWAAEELHYLGAQAFYEQHKNESALMSLVMESDTGTFAPGGIEFSGNNESTLIMQQVLNLLEPINAGSLIPGGNGAEGDPGQFVQNDGVPGASLFADKEKKYFWYHHSPADSMTMMDDSSLDLCTIVWTTIAYVVADLDSLLPHSLPATFYTSDSDIQI